MHPFDLCEQVVLRWQIEGITPWFAFNSDALHVGHISRRIFPKHMLHMRCPLPIQHAAEPAMKFQQTLHLYKVFSIRLYSPSIADAVDVDSSGDVAAAAVAVASPGRPRSEKEKNPGQK